MSDQENLEPHQYEAVLHYMEAANVGDFDSALRVMRQY